MKKYSKATGGFYDTKIHNSGEIPRNAVDISDSKYAELMMAQASGHVIQGDAKGRPVAKEPDREPVDRRRSSLKASIDQAAGGARSRFVSPGELVDQEYLAAEVQSDKFRAAGYPSGAVPSEVQTWAEATGMTPEAAADDIIATGQSWRSVLASIRAIRLAGKAAVDAAEDADIEATAANYIDQLNGVAPS